MTVKKIKKIKKIKVQLKNESMKSTALINPPSKANFFYSSFACIKVSSNNLF